MRDPRFASMVFAHTTQNSLHLLLSEVCILLLGFNCFGQSRFQLLKLFFRHGLADLVLLWDLHDVPDQGALSCIESDSR